MNATATTSLRETFCTFTLGDLFFGVEVLQVQEVIRHQRMTRVPLAPERIQGLMNLRGQIVTALDLGTRLGFARRSHDEAMNVVIRTPDGVVSLLVDEIGDVVEVNRQQFEPPPDTLQGVSRELIRGAYKLEGRLLLVLDIQKAINEAA
ncbi:MAG: chemotaxis protein CheW [Pirellulaceae bacterium]|nr:chemotaxis protein CheW [Planctomycetales bacterium]